MGIVKEIKARQIQKHDIAENWDKITGFIPQKGEIIVYDAEDGSAPRVKIGDGVNLVKDLPFSGSGMTTKNNSAIFNNYENNYAYGSHSNAMGYGTNAGTLAFGVASISDLSEQSKLAIQLSKEATKPVYGKMATIANENVVNVSSLYGDFLNADGTYKYAISISSDISRHWTDCGDIIGINENQNLIFVSTERLKNKDILIPSDGDTNRHYYFYTQAAPDKGSFTLGGYSLATGHSTQAIGVCSMAEGYLTAALANYSHVEGLRTTATAQRGHAEGTDTLASGTSAHAEGDGSIASNTAAHAEGAYVQDKTTQEKFYTTAAGKGSHAEGGGTNASGNYSHAEGQRTSATGANSHAEGEQSIASGNGAHAEGRNSEASGTNAHAEGFVTKATAQGAHSEGRNTIAASTYQHVQGKYNIEDASGKYAHIVGNGTSTTPSNAHTLDWYGNAWFAGAIDVENAATTLSNLGLSLTAAQLNNAFIYQRKLTSSDNLDDIKNNGIYYYETGNVPINAPFTNAAIVEVIGVPNVAATKKLQRVTRYGYTESKYRALATAGWSAWAEYALIIDNALPISKGGTGSTTAAAARTALEISDHIASNGTSGVWSFWKYNSGLCIAMGTPTVSWSTQSDVVTGRKRSVASLDLNGIFTSIMGGTCSNVHRYVDCWVIPSSSTTVELWATTTVIAGNTLYATKPKVVLFGKWK